MNDQLKITVLGGDRRQIYAAKKLKEFYAVTVCGFDLYGDKEGLTETDDLACAMRSDVIVLPVPASKNDRTLNASYAGREIPLKEIVSHTEAGKTVLAGMIGKTFRKELSAAGAEVTDYYTREDLAVRNALLTAEGVTGIILEKLPVTVHGLSAAVTGYGRVAFHLCRILQGMGADVTVFARDPVQRAKAGTTGLAAAPLDRLPEEAGRFSCVINTVPFPVIGENAIANSRDNCLFIETASAPYGIDFGACESHKRALVKAFSLPGKTAPETAGGIIAETVRSILKETAI